MAEATLAPYLRSERRTMHGTAEELVRRYNRSGCTGLRTAPICFLELHDRQAGTIFPLVCEPPRLKGVR